MEIILPDSHVLSLRKMPRQDVFSTMRPLAFGAPSCHCHRAPPLYRSEDHQPVTDPMALVFVIGALRITRLGRQPLTGFDDLVLTGFIQTHQGLLW